MRRVEGSGSAPKSWWLSLFSWSESTARDFIKMRSHRAKDIMTRNVHVVAPDTPVADIARLLEEKRIKRVPVVENDRVVGIVSRGNLMQALASIPKVTLDPSISNREKREVVMGALAQVPGLNPAHLNVVVEGDRVDVWGDKGVWIIINQGFEAATLPAFDPDALRHISARQDAKQCTSVAEPLATS